MTVNSAQAVSSSDSEHEAQVARLQSQLSKRRAREEALAREQEFLRTSLRNSERLKALSKSRPAPQASSKDVALLEVERTISPPAVLSANVGIVNDAFEHEDDDVSGTATLPRRPVLLVDVVSDLLDDLRSDDDDEEFVQKLDWLQRYVQSPEVRRAFDVERRVVATYDRAPHPETQEAVTNFEEVETFLLLWPVVL